jgi:hypothetical protein
VYQSHTISLPIARTAKEVYEFLADPRNFPKWVGGIEPGFTEIGPNEWSGEMAMGVRIVRFCDRNRYGVLDHAMYAEGDEPLVTPMRVVPYGTNCLLTFTFYRRDTITDEQFASAIEWITTDFLALRSLLEV